MLVPDVVFSLESLVAADFLPSCLLLFMVCFYHANYHDFPTISVDFFSLPQELLRVKDPGKINKKVLEHGKVLTIPTTTEQNKT